MQINVLNIERQKRNKNGFINIQYYIRSLRTKYVHIIEVYFLKYHFESNLNQLNNTVLYVDIIGLCDYIAIL